MKKLVGLVVLTEEAGQGAASRALPRNLSAEEQKENRGTAKSLAPSSRDGRPGDDHPDNQAGHEGQAESPSSREKFLHQPVRKLAGQLVGGCESPAGRRARTLQLENFSAGRPGSGGGWLP